MHEMQTIRMIFCFLSAGTAVLLLIAFELYCKYLMQEKKCTAKSVMRHTTAAREGENSAVCMPVVSCIANEKTYKVTGSGYKGYKIVTKSTPWNENSDGCCKKNQVLYINRSTSAMLGFYRNPMKKPYSKQSTAYVWCCPKNPKLTHVLRLCDKKWVLWLRTCLL